MNRVLPRYTNCCSSKITQSEGDSEGRTYFEYKLAFNINQNIYVVAAVLSVCNRSARVFPLSKRIKRYMCRNRLLDIIALYGGYESEHQKNIMRFITRMMNTHCYKCSNISVKFFLSQVLPGMRNLAWSRFLPKSVVLMYTSNYRWCLLPFNL